MNVQWNWTVEMRRNGIRFLVALFFAVAMFGLEAAARPGAETYKQNSQGLEKQFEAFLKAYQKGDDKGMDDGFRVFGFPNPKEWFGKHFSSEDAEKLSSEYERQVTDAESSLIQDMNLAEPGSRFKVHCEPHEEFGALAAKPGEGRAEPTKPILVEQFQFEFRSTGHNQKFRFIANFVYEDGAYRFVGGGGAPFWVKAAGT